MTEQRYRTPTELEQEEARLTRFLSRIAPGTTEHSALEDWMEFGSLDWKERDASKETEYQIAVRRIAARRIGDQRYAEVIRKLDEFLFQLTGIEQRIGLSSLPYYEDARQEPFFAKRAAYGVIFSAVVDEKLVPEPQLPRGWASS